MFSYGGLMAIADGEEDIWIVPQGANQAPRVTNIPESKYVAWIFNPWPESAPMGKMVLA